MTDNKDIILEQLQDTVHKLRNQMLVTPEEEDDLIEDLTSAVSYVKKQKASQDQVEWHFNTN